jgi:hypothetical protein
MWELFLRTLYNEKDAFGKYRESIFVLNVRERKNNVYHIALSYVMTCSGEHKLFTCSTFVQHFSCRKYCRNICMKHADSTVPCKGMIYSIITKLRVLSMGSVLGK